MSSNDVNRPAKSCPRCRSERVHRAHRRAALDQILYTLGAEIRRCHDCRCRHASFSRFSIPVGEPQSMAGLWTGFVVMGSGFLACLLFVLWIIRRFSELSG
jgi:hypothetical protein